MARVRRIDPEFKDFYLALPLGVVEPRGFEPLTHCL